MSRVALPLLVLAAALWTAPAAAQSLDFTYKSGAAVMGEPSTVTLTATNNTGRPIHEVSLRFKPNDGYDLDGGEAPAGWVVSNIDRKNRIITFSSDCLSGIPAGGSKDFSVRMVGEAASTDQLGQNFQDTANGAVSRGVCVGTNQTDVTYKVNASAAQWRRVGLSAALVASPRTLPTGARLTLRLDVTNRSTATQYNITAPTPTVVGTAGFKLESSPAALPTLAAGQSGSFTWTFSATAVGTAVFRVGASGSGLITSPQVDSPMVNVANFAALAEVVPSRVVPGSTVTLRLVVANNTSDPVQAVSASAPVFSGTASVTRVSGPTPASIDTVNPGATGTFTWTYTVSGKVGSTFQWSSQATGTQAGTTLTTAQVSTSVGYLVTHQVTASPESVLGGTATPKTVTYTVFNGGDDTLTQVDLLLPDPVFAKDPTGAFSADTSGWNTAYLNNNPQGYRWTAPSGKGIAPGASQAFTLRYASIGSVAVTTAYSHKMVLTESAGTQSRVEASVTVLANRTLPSVSNFTVVSANGRNVLTWTNPSDHDGVTVLRAPVTVSATLEPGRTYALGEAVGNATVVYTDQASAASAFSDTGVKVGQTYYYRVHNQDGYHFYATGAPSANGLIATVTDGQSPRPAWCYSTGFHSLLQPLLPSSPAGLFSSANSGSLYSLISAPGSATDGTERWRPVSLAGPVQSRFPVVSLTGQSEPWMLTGDQAGNAYALRSSNGQQVWTQKLFGVIQAAPQVQQRSKSSTAFQTKYPYDLVYFVSADSGTTNSLVALRADTGAKVWTFAPGSLGKVSGTPTVDATNDHLIFAARAGTTGGNTVFVLNTVDGTVVKSFALGDSDYSVVRDASSNLALVTANNGKVYGVDLTTLNVLLDVQVTPAGSSAAFSNFVFPVGKGFIASLSSGTVQRWALTQAQAGGPWTANAVWTAQVNQPSGVAVDFANQLVFVGTGDGTVVELDGLTGAVKASRSISGVPQVIGTPGVDPNTSRVHVGSADGRICAFPIPF